jgi:hypothetical protein
MRERFFPRVLRATLPLIVWILHFAFVYGTAAAQCSPGGWRPEGPDRALLGGVTVAALAFCGWLAWGARKVPSSPRAGLLDWTRLVLALLATVAIAWNGIPLLLVAGCA